MAEASPASPEDAARRSIYAPPLGIVAACDGSRSAASSLLSWMVPEARPLREEALADFMGRLAPRYEGPILLFDLFRIEQTLRLLSETQRRHRCRFLLPVKSFPHPVIAALACRHLAGFDVSNLAEYRSLPDDLSGKIVALTGPVLQTDHLPAYLERGNDLLIFIDSAHQLAQLESVRTPLRYGFRLDSSALLRDLPEGAPSRLHRSRFGLSPEPGALLPLLSSSRHRFAGFHVHHGSERNDSETYMAMVEGILELRAALGVRFDCVDFGGGQQHLDLDSLEGLAAQVRGRIGAETELFFEPGRLITREAGYAVGRVENWRRRDDAVEYVLDLSMDCHLRWSAPTLIVPRPANPERPLLARFYGPTCHEEDHIGQFGVWTAPGDRPPFQHGDLVLFGGISGYSASIRTSFNGIEPANVVFFS